MGAAGKIEPPARSDELARASGVRAATARAAGPAAVGADHVAYVVVPASGAGQRLDNFLLRLARGVPKSHVYRIVRSGEVRVNRARASVDQRLREGDELRIPPLRVSAPRPANAPAQVPPVIYEDGDILAVDKPAGLAAHGGSGIAHGLIECIRAARPNQPMLELAHRLDRETSGLLLLAKTRRALLGLHEMLRAGEIDKRYLVLVAGDWVNDRQHVRLPLLKRPTTTGERRVVVDHDVGQEAHSVFNLLHRYGAWSLLEADLRTGRTHQIRVHLSHLGFPIAGDDRYGDFAVNRDLARGAAGRRLARMFLHAHRVTFAHPVGGAPMVLEAPLPAECRDFLDALGPARQS